MQAVARRAAHGGVTQPALVEGHFQSRSCKLHYRHWSSGDAEQARSAAVVINHGYGEHAGSYDHFARFLVQHGHPVCALDARGHGASPGLRGHIHDYGQYVDDASAFATLVQARYQSRPLVVLGHSAGGLITTLMLQRTPSLAAAVILSSPLFGLQPQHRPLGPWLAQAAALLAARLPLPNGIADRELTHDPAILQAYKRDPLRHGRTTPAWYAATWRATHQVARDAGRLSVPVLTVAAEHDPVVDPDVIAQVVASFSSADRSFLVRENAYHEVLNERDREELYQVIAQWIERRFSSEHTEAACSNAS